MRLSAITIAFASTLLFSAAAFADGTAAPTTPATTASPTAAPTTDAAPAANPEDDTVTCRYEAITGSNFKKRICHTQREWKQMATDSRELMDRIDSRDRNGVPGGN